MIGVLTDEVCREIMKNNFLGRLGCCQDNIPYVVPLNYLCDGQTIFAHSKYGRKIKMMHSNPEVCFEVDEIESFTSWKTVIAWGKFEEIIDEKEKWEAMELFLAHLMYVKVSETAQPPETSETRRHPRSMVNTVVYKINISNMTGRFENDEE